MHKLRIGADRDGFFVVPEKKSSAGKAPLIVTLHGAGGNGHDAIQPFRRAAAEFGIILLAPDSRGKSWNARKDDWGPDVDFLDLALARVFERCGVNENGVALAGFSDGASYALSLGLGNGALFTHLIAFSPGFMRAPTEGPKPRVFVSHGSEDPVLSAVRCSHRIVSRLERDGYEVQFREFAGAHTVPQEVSRDSIDWFLNKMTDPLERHL
ncbi:MAG TPA: hypothetical protein VM166_11610 [Gemmatimonadaceae bacterium]|nr:hypothetical protein [Gemmatimonadaceae bacterium]